MRSTLLALFCLPSLLTSCGSSSCRDTGTCPALVEAGALSADSGAGKSGSGGAGKSGSNGDSGAGGENPGDAGTGGQGGAAGSDGGSPCVDCPDGGDGSEPAPMCAATPVTGCTPSATNAFFVDASANAGDGSLASPFTTLSAAISAAQAASVTDIYLCAGTYAETVHLDATAVNLHGGFDCTTWHYAETNVVTIAPGVAGEYALHVENVASSIILEDLTFEAADGDATHKSSIAAFIEGSDSVTFNRAVLTAGAGVDGSSGSLDTYAAGDEWPTAEELNGNPGTMTTGGPVKGPVVCPRTDSSFGGKGGDNLPENGTDGGPGTRGGTGGTGVNCGIGGTGQNGNPGPDGANGDGATLAGTLSASGWALTSGEDGFDGEVGGGGGGGAGAASGGGGSGGAGGCGAAGSTGAQSGGSSIALLSLNSLITLNASALITADAGNGGDSVAGQNEGQNGGELANGDPSGCPGGNGAKGGAGGAGGGGAGGLSVAIVWRGATAPTVDTATTSATVLGQEGSAGDGGAGDNAGVTGVSQDLLEI